MRKVALALVATLIGAWLPMLVDGKPQLALQTSPARQMTAFAFSSDARLAVSGGADGSIGLWHIPTRTLLRQLQLHENEVTGLAILPDGEHALSASADGGVVSWDLRTGKPLQSMLEHQSPVRHLVSAPDGQWAVSITVDGEARRWHHASGRTSQLIKPKSPSTALLSAVSPDGRWYGELTAADTLIVWDLKSATHTQMEIRHTAKAGALALANKGNTVVIGFDDGVVQMLNLADGHVVKALPMPDLVESDKAAVSWKALRLDRRGEHLLAASNRRVQVWNLTTQERVHSQILPSIDVAALNDAGEVFGAGSSFLFQVIGEQNNPDVKPHPYRLAANLAMGQPAGAPIDEIRPLGMSLDVLTHVALSDSGVLAVASLNLTGSRLRLFNVRDGYPMRDLAAGAKLKPTAIALSRDGKQLAMGAEDGRIHIYSVRDGGRVWEFAAHEGHISALAFSADGQLLVSGAADRSVNVWALGERQRRHTNCCHAGAVRSLDLIDTKLFVEGDGQTRVLDVVTGEVQYQEQGVRLPHPFHHTQKGLIAAVDNLLAGRWGELKNWSQPAHGAYISEVKAVDARRLGVTSSHDGTVRFWDLKNGRELLALSFGMFESWAAVTPHGRYDSSSSESSNLSWIMPDDPFTPLPIRIFERDYFEPDLIAEVLAPYFNTDFQLDPEIDVQPVRFRSALGLDALNTVQPRVTIHEVTASAEIPTAVDIRMTLEQVGAKRMRDGKPTLVSSGFGGLRIYRNDQLVRELRPTEVTFDRTGKASVLVRNVRLPMTQDLNNMKVMTPNGLVRLATFRARALNRDGLFSESAESLYQLPPDEPRERSIYLIAIGVDTTESGKFQLKYATKDAFLVAGGFNHLFTDLAGPKRIVPILVSSVFGKDASKEHVHAVLRRLAGEQDVELPSLVDANELRPARPEDIIVLYIASHAEVRDNQFRLILHSAAGRGEGYVSADELSAWLRPIDAGFTTLILDTCYASAAIEGIGTPYKPHSLIGQGLGQLAFDKNMLVLASSQPEQSAREDLSGTLGQSLLAHALINEAVGQKMAGKARDDGKLTLLGMFAWAQVRVPQLDAQLRAIELKNGPRPEGRTPAFGGQIQQPRIYNYAGRNARLPVESSE